ncbi:PREDICTED: myotubularin-related protein 10-like [Priapulus caudatus]|uniref:Myotubularin-related protein 10-like n=1 Tax=Priapulus caudatus TaxID=37621 RepID=A0ABM1EB23_PRICU|nr:PREDICTED: myotubularin-related protein 10-like [Priapulus caudatus]
MNPVHYLLEKKKRNRTSFKSYVDDPSIASIGIAATSNLSQTQPQEQIEELYEPIGSTGIPDPKLLPGEIEIAKAHCVLRFNPLAGHAGGSGSTGVLVITNFKVSFMTAGSTEQHATYQGQQNNLVGNDDIALTNVESVFQVTGGKLRRLAPGSSVYSSVEAIQLHCKDFRIVTFSFKLCRNKENQSRAIVNTILHYAFPARVALLFGFDFRKRIAPFTSLPLYRVATDWSKELANVPTKVKWRVASCNEAFRISESLPAHFVVPATVSDDLLRCVAANFNQKRVLVWSWTSAKDISLLRMSTLQVETPESESQLNSILREVRSTHPKNKRAQVHELHRCCPTVREIQDSYYKLRELCMPESVKQFWSQDERWLSNLEASQWLTYVRQCLKAAVHVCDVIISKQLSVVLQEPGDRDLNCIVSCLVQLLQEPRFRSLHGFQCLIQREWVVMGHPFFSRLCHLRNMDERKGPVFLLFLDCVWQLTQQFPAAFEFTETYLTTLWDSTHLGLFETFLFDSEADRQRALREQQVKLMCVWDWPRQFGREDLSLFRNPLYVARREMEVAAAAGGTRQAAPAGGLDASASAASVRLWRQCYLRWVPLANIVGGGAPSSYLQQCILAGEAIHLRDQLDVLTQVAPVARRQDADLFFGCAQQHGDSSPGAGFTSAFPFNSSVAMSVSGMSDRQVALSTPPLSAFVKHSSLANIELLEDDLQDCVADMRL